MAVAWPTGSPVHGTRLFEMAKKRKPGMASHWTVGRHLWVGSTAFLRGKILHPQHLSLLQQCGQLWATWGSACLCRLEDNQGGASETRAANTLQTSLGKMMDHLGIECIEILVVKPLEEVACLQQKLLVCSRSLRHSFFIENL
eukprot:GGOE01022170.1.p2 GENE.GGOE01022170.1~~GGOE01022170.1.p2  ORF type:complete len:143 (+),score=1.32 GGOE01022170.1:366-794(+)